MVWDLFRNFS